MSLREVSSIWVPKSFVKTLSLEAGSKFPLETGGVILGYATGMDIVITNATFPGSNAIHTPNGFIPDHDFDEAQVAQAYMDSGGIKTYLGDWHSHPNQAKAALSSKDKSTLKLISRSKEARCPQPIMAVFNGADESWNFTIWRRLRQKSLLRKAVIRKQHVRIY
jgi:integrative and conjugative element protein (TIGR02256 family)